jgi:hypothetical protein
MADASQIGTFSGSDSNKVRPLSSTSRRSTSPTLRKSTTSASRRMCFEISPINFRRSGMRCSGGSTVIRSLSPASASVRDVVKTDRRLPFGPAHRTSRSSMPRKPRWRCLTETARPPSAGRGPYLLHSPATGLSVQSFARRLFSRWRDGSGSSRLCATANHTSKMSDVRHAGEE